MNIKNIKCTQYRCANKLVSILGGIKMQEIKRGDVWLVDLGKPDGTSKQSGIRPVIITSNNKANMNSPVIHVVPLTTRVKSKLPTHLDVDIDNMESGIIIKSIVLAEQVMLIDKGLLHKKLGQLDLRTMDKVDIRIMIQFGLYERVRNIKQELNILKQKTLARC